MMGSRFEIASDLDADAQVVLAHAATLDGVNRELAPFLRMTAPSEFRSRSLLDAPVGIRLFRSWLLVGGLLPVDFDHLRFESIDPASGFAEASTMLSMASWQHDRRVTALPGARCRLVDRVSFVPRVPGTSAFLLPVCRALFAHRHRRLRALFGPAPG